MTVYTDNAATTKMSESVITAMYDIMKNQYGNPSSLHHVGQQAKEILESAREKVARAINASPKEIYFTSGGSEADNQAIVTAAKIGEKTGKKHIITSKFEHHAVLHTLDALKKEGFEVTYLDVYENGIVKVEDLKKAIRPDTCLVTIMTINNEVGTIQPVKELGRVCKENKIIFHTDSVQAVGHIPVDVQDMNVDMLSISAHKLHGPKGIGALYCRKGIPLTNIIYGGAQERNKRAGTENLPAIVGFATAIEDAIEKLDENTEYITSLRDRLIDGVKDIEKIKINGDLNNHSSCTVNMCFEGIEGESLILLLDQKGICASSGSACTSGSLDPSHVLLAMGVPVENAHGSLRISFSEYNTIDEVDYIVDSIKTTVDYLRTISPVWEAIKKEEVNK